MEKVKRRGQMAPNMKEIINSVRKTDKVQISLKMDHATLANLAITKSMGMDSTEERTAAHLMAIGEMT